MSERIEHAGWLGVVTYLDGEYVIVWRPKDPKWREPDADVESVAGIVYSQTVEAWEVAVDHYAAMYRGD